MAMTLHRGLLDTRDYWWLEDALVPQLPDFAYAEPIYEGTYTRIQHHPDCNALISKLSWVKTALRDSLRKYWACQAQREIRANRILHGLGLATAELLGVGIPLAPWARLESILFMHELPPHDTLRVVLRAVTDPGRRDTLLDRVAADVAAIYRNGYHHKDCHLENVLAVRTTPAESDTRWRNESFIWVDNDLRYSNNPERARRRLAGSLQQLVDTSPDFISTREWRYFAGALAGHLDHTDLGRKLAATTVADFKSMFDHGA